MNVLNLPSRWDILGEKVGEGFNKGVSSGLEDLAKQRLFQVQNDYKQNQKRQLLHEENESFKQFLINQGVSEEDAERLKTAPKPFKDEASKLFAQNPSNEAHAIDSKMLMGELTPEQGAMLKSQIGLLPQGGQQGGTGLQQLAQYPQAQQQSATEQVNIEPEINAVPEQNLKEPEIKNIPKDKEFNPNTLKKPIFSPSKGDINTLNKMSIDIKNSAIKERQFNQKLKIAEDKQKDSKQRDVNNRYKKYNDDVSQRAESSEKILHAIDLIEGYEKTGKLSGPAWQYLYEKMPYLKIYTASDQDFAADKAISSFLEELPRIFKGPASKFKIEAYAKRFPSLLQTAGGRAEVIKDLRETLFDNIKENDIRHEILEGNEYNVPVGIDVKVAKALKEYKASKKQGQEIAPVNTQANTQVNNFESRFNPTTGKQEFKINNEWRS